MFNIAAIEPSTVLGVVVFIAGGILGAILLSSLFDLGLVILSSLVGAQILLGGLGQLVELPDGITTIALVVLIVRGTTVSTWCVAQTLTLINRKS